MGSSATSAAIYKDTLYLHGKKDIFTMYPALTFKFKGFMAHRLQICKLPRETLG